MNNYNIYIIISVSIHLIGMMFLASAPKPPNPNKGNSKVNIKIVESEKDQEGSGSDSAKDGNNSSKGRLIPKSVVDGNGKKCKDWYGGVGLQHIGAQVIYIPEGYAAHKAGVKYGDLIFDVESLRGPPGTPTTLKFMRGSQVFNVNVIREVICQDN